MRAFLRHYFATKRRSTVDAVEFQDMVEDFHGQSLEALFDEFVYNTGATGGAGDGGGSSQGAHHRI